MSKADKFLAECKKNVGKWVCSLHTTGSNQPAAIFREVKKMGYEFEEVAPNRWASTRYCPICKQQTTHYKLLKATPTLTTQTRLTIDSATRKRILSIFDNKDAFTGASISSVAEIDHKTPWTRLGGQDVDARKMTEEEIKNNFQLLTREHNLLKDRACDFCKKNNKRPPFLEIPFWYEGDENYRGTCVGCGWYDGKKWRKSITKFIL
jgi:hypothetical protein